MIIAMNILIISIIVCIINIIWMMMMMMMTTATTTTMMIRDNSNSCLVERASENGLSSISTGCRQVSGRRPFAPGDVKLLSTR